MGSEMDRGEGVLGVKSMPLESLDWLPSDCTRLTREPAKRIELRQMPTYPNSRMVGLVEREVHARNLTFWNGHVAERVGLRPRS